MTSADRLMQTIRTLVLAPMGGSAVFTIIGFIIGLVLLPPSNLDAKTLLWMLVFEFMVATVALALPGVVLLALLHLIRRFRPSLVSGGLLATALSMCIGAAAGAGMMYALLARSGHAVALDAQNSVMVLSLALGGAITGMLVARRTERMWETGASNATINRQRSNYR